MRGSDMPDDRRACDATRSVPRFIVGVGASAGGLEAVTQLLHHAQLEDVAFVVIQHLDPHHESLLTELLARACHRTVTTAAGGMMVEPGQVYVVPPNADLALLNGALQLLSPRGAHGVDLPIDFFFRSLADDRSVCAIGVVLSGTGTDGTLGLRAIKAGGGITFVQSPETAGYDGMPKSALGAGVADHCLSPIDIARELTKLAAHPRSRRAPPANAPPPDGSQLAKLLSLVRSECRADLSGYKTATVERRVERRMMLHRLSDPDEYLQLVRSSPAELRALCSDLLITVTSFFRDQEPFDALRSRYLPELIDQKTQGGALRVWVPACATGEEAYSIAMLLEESCEERGRELEIQVFGTDLDEASIQTARRGIYPPNIGLDVPADRLARFFDRRDGEFQVSRRLRDACVFSRHDALADAPFSRIDVVSCRNLLIYLQPPTQQRLLRALHYALAPAGLLMLGRSETVGDAPDLFVMLDRKNKIYRKKQVPSLATLDLTGGLAQAREPVRPGAAARPALTLQAYAERKILELYGPPGVLVNERMEVLHFRGRTGRYLDPAPGAASFDLLRLARPELHIALKRAVEASLSDDRRTSGEVLLYEDGAATRVTIDVVPLLEPETKARCLLVLFHEMPAEPAPHLSPAELGDDDARRPLAQRVQELERELALTKDYLQNVLEEKESAAQELKSANEELQSSNEELQSINEELETSKEELQSTNEELTTVNEELQNRMVELGQINDDLHNVLTGSDNAVIIVGMDLRIRRYTAAAAKLLELTAAAHMGRSVDVLDRFLASRDVAERVARVTSSLATTEHEVLAHNQRWYALRIAPYKTLDHAIRGAVLTLTDIDVRKKAADLTRDVGAYAEQFLAAINHPLAILDARARVTWANRPFYDAFRFAPEEVIGSALFDGSAAGEGTALRGRLDATLAKGTPFRDVTVIKRFPDVGERVLRIAGSRIPVPADQPLVLVSIEIEPRMDPPR
jgi:two-component system, chemotaxis family, CheB/CheR fusion protein